MKTLIVGGSTDAATLAEKLSSDSKYGEIVLLNPGFKVPTLADDRIVEIPPWEFTDRNGVRIISEVTPLWLDRPNHRVIVRFKSGVIGNEYYDDIIIAGPVPADFHGDGDKSINIPTLDSPERFPIGKRIKMMLAQRKAGAPPALRRSRAIVLCSDALDRTVAAFAIACGLAASGIQVNMLFSFWGLAPLIDHTRHRGFLKSMLRGPSSLPLSCHDWCGFGRWMFRRAMRQAKVPSVQELMAEAKNLNVKFYACETGMKLFGLSRDELIDVDGVIGIARFTMIMRSGEETVFFS